MSFIKGRRLVVTGGAGFLGQALCHELKSYEPANVFIPRSIEYDLRHRTAIRRLFQVAQPDIVIHLAAVVGGIGANMVNPGLYFYDNAIMGIQLMEEARLHGVAKFVGIGSICSYPKHTPVPFKEDDLWMGYPEETNAPYGLAKKMLMVQAQAYRKQYDLNAITLLPVNLYGPRDNFDADTSHVIPALVRKAITVRDAGQELIDVWGTGRASREFLYVADAARGIALATEFYNDPDPVNIGSGVEVSIGELAETICALCDFKGTIRWDTSKPDGQPRRCLDTTRAKKAFGFEATTSLRDGLSETIAWYDKEIGRRLNTPRLTGQ